MDPQTISLHRLRPGFPKPQRIETFDLHLQKHVVSYPTVEVKSIQACHTVSNFLVQPLEI